MLPPHCLLAFISRGPEGVVMFSPVFLTDSQTCGAVVLKNRILHIQMIQKEVWLVFHTLTLDADSLQFALFKNVST